MRVQQHLSRYLLGYAVAAMALGLALGYPQASWTKTHSRLLGDLTTVGAFLIIFPMMINVRFGALVKAGRNVKGLLLALAFNFLWAPLLGWGLAHLFLHDPQLALGFLLVMVVPCSSMSIAYTGLADGDLELATVVVASSFVLALLAVPAWMMVFASGYNVPVPMHDLLVSIATVLLAPMLLGFLTRHAIVRRRGHEAVKRLQPLLGAFSMLAMFAIIFLIFFAKEQMIVAKWQTVLLLLIPNALFIALTLLAATWLDRRLGLSYRDHMAVVFAATGKNNATAIAIAAVAFSPLVAVPAATMPIFQVLLLVGYLKAANWVRRYFAANEPTVQTTLARAAVSGHGG
jgi:ACR3 family arsenite efflux pump ArsB